MRIDNLKRREDEEIAAQALVHLAADTSESIRRRLAVVAEELRTAAATAATEKDRLLRLATVFEHHSKPGDRP